MNYAKGLSSLNHTPDSHSYSSTLRMSCPTCPDAIFERVPAVHQDLLQGLGLVGQLQVEALHALQELVRVVEVQHLGGAVESLLDVVGEDVDHLQQELYGGLLSIFGGQQV